MRNLGKPLVSKGTYFWRGPHRDVVEARRHPGWAAFHKRCAQHGLYFDDVDLWTRGKFGAVALRLETRTGYTLRYKVSDGFGPTPIAAVIAAFEGALSEGFPVPSDIADLLRGGTPSSIEDMLG